MIALYAQSHSETNYQVTNYLVPEQEQQPIAEALHRESVGGGGAAQRDGGGGVDGRSGEHAHRVLELERDLPNLEGGGGGARMW